MLYRYSVRVRGEDTRKRSDVETADNPYQVREEVWVKPPSTRCDLRYREGIVTGLVSNQVTEVDGIPRHVRDLRHRISPQNPQDQGTDTFGASNESLLVTFSVHDAPQVDQALEGSDEDVGNQQLRRSTRTRKPRQCLVCDCDEELYEK